MTVQFVAAAGLSLVLLVLVADVLVAAYARGVVRAALDEGARAGARAEAPAAECVRRATAVLDDLLGGALRSDVGAVSCDAGADQIRATTHVASQAWLPGLPGRAYEATAVAVREPLE